MKKRYTNPQIFCLRIKPNTHLLTDSIERSEDRRTNEVLSRRHSSHWEDDEEEDYE